MKRRSFIVTAAVTPLIEPCVAYAQRKGSVPRIGLLSNNPWTDVNALAVWNAFRSELQRLGWSEGQTVVFELASSDSAFERLPAVARELFNRGVDLIVVAGGVAAAAVRGATQAIPVVFVTVSDPVGSGLVNSLARPGGNLSGLADVSVELIGKRLELLTEIARGAKRVGYLTHTTAASWADEEAGRAGAALDLQWMPVAVRREDELPGAIAQHPDAEGWLVGDGIRAFGRAEVTSSFAMLRKPVVYPSSNFVSVGGLISYAANAHAQFRRAAWFVDRILRGTKIGDLPVELPSQYELMVNLRTARAQGITIPHLVLVRADEMIE